MHLDLTHISLYIAPLFKDIKKSFFGKNLLFSAVEVFDCECQQTDKCHLDVDWCPIIIHAYLKHKMHLNITHISLYIAPLFKDIKKKFFWKKILLFSAVEVFDCECQQTDKCHLDVD